MKKRLKRILSVACLLVLLPSFASAKVGVRNLEHALQRHMVCTSSSAAAPTSADNTMGTAGVLSRQALPAYATHGPQVQTGSVAQPLMPMKLQVFTDNGGSGSPTCTVTIDGVDQFGIGAQDIVSASTSATLTSNVYEKIKKVTVTGCSTGSTDHATVGQSLVLGLQRKIRKASDVLSACIVDSSASEATLCAPVDKNSDGDGDSGDLLSAVSTASHSLDATATVFGVESQVAGAAGDQVCFTVLPSQ